VWFVDDASSEAVPASLTKRPAHLAKVTVLRLRRNLGHQRAIAIGLTSLYVRGGYDAVIVMDGDGEDRPQDVPELLDRCAQSNWSKVVFAQRTKRSEGFGFRLGYATFKVLHRLLVGRKVEVGNFSVVPHAALARLVSVSELWNHYAAAVQQARIPIDMLPAARAQRIAGQSQMNLTALVMHGLSAISVYGDVVGVRLLRLTAMAIGAVVLAMLSVVAVRLGTDLAIPGWATSALGLLLVSLLILTAISMMMVLFILRARSEYGFLPLRDYAHFVLDERVLYEAEP
jgi:glycosyltransferase involved in cell wall biosynthesis